MGQNVEFPSNGHSAGGYLASPEDGSGPGLVVIQEWWGLVPHILDVCDRFAAEGFVALVPDLYHGTKVPNSEPDEAGKVMMSLNLDQAGRDLGGAVAYLQGLESVTSDGVGVTGFCMGGGLAMITATQQPAVAACVPWYGLIPWEHAQPDWSALHAPLLAHIAEEDEYFGPGPAAELEATLEGLGKTVDFEVYRGADHAFFNDTRPEVFDPVAAELAFTRTVDFLHAQLG